nr:hypothetical protein [Tanacetum cinerariifolium]
MSSLFADTHNVVAILEKSDAAKGFEQVIDFLSRSYIHYALTVSPHIYISCIKQFWNTASVKRSGNVTRLQALVDKKKIVISEDVIREILQLNDAEGIVCLPNEEIFAGLAQMGYEKPSTKLTFYKAFFSSQWKFLIHTILQSLIAKRTYWNEFSTAMASAVICLSKGQKFNFSKYIFDSLVRNVDSSSKLYMVGKGFSGVETPLFEGVETPLFEGMLAVRQPAEEKVAEAQVQVNAIVAAAVGAHDAKFPTQLQQVLNVCSALSKRVENLETANAAQTLEIIQLKARLQQVLNVCSALSKRVENLETANDAQTLEIIQLKARVKKLEKDNKIKSSKLRRLRKVGTSRRVESSNDIEDVFNQGRMIADMDMNEGIEKKGVIIRDPKEELPLKTPAETPKVKDKGKGILVEAPKPMKKKDQIEMDAEYARKLQEEIDRDHDGFNKDVDWDVAMDHVNKKSSILEYSCGQALGCSFLPNEEIFPGLARMGYEKSSTKLTFYKAFFSTQWKFFIHTILRSLSAKRTLWNEFSSAMESALICLSLGQRFNFSKYIFESLVHNVDSSSKFYMYPRFIQLIIQSNIADLSKYTNRYISPVLTQKVFANMRRVGKGFSGVETPLFETMLAVRDIAEEAEAQIPAQDDDVREHAEEEVATDVVPPTPTSPSPSSTVIPSLPPHQSPCPPQPQAAEGSSHMFQQVLDTCSALVLRVEGLETANAAQQLEIVKLKARVKKLEKLNKGRISVYMDQDEGIELVVDQENDAEIEGRQADKQAEIYNIDLVHSSKVVTAPATHVVVASTPIPAAKPKTLKIASAAPAVSTRRRKGVVIRDPEEELHTDTPSETPTMKDKGKGILIEDPKPMKERLAKETQYIKRYHGFKKKPQSKSKARKNMISYLKNTEGFKMEFFKGKTYDQILLIFQARFDANLKFLFKTREEIEKEDEEIIKSINETPAQKEAKRRKLSEEAQEADDLFTEIICTTTFRI